MSIEYFVSVGVCVIFPTQKAVFEIFLPEKICKNPGCSNYGCDVDLRYCGHCGCSVFLYPAKRRVNQDIDSFLKEKNYLYPYITKNLEDVFCLKSLINMDLKRNGTDFFNLTSFDLDEEILNAKLNHSEFIKDLENFYGADAKFCIGVLGEEY